MLDRFTVFKTRPCVLVLHTKSSRKQPSNHLRSVKRWLCIFMCGEVSGCACMHVCVNMMGYIFLRHPAIFLDANQVGTKLPGDTVTRQPALSL